MCLIQRSGSTTWEGREPLLTHSPSWSTSCQRRDSKFPQRPWKPPVWPPTSTSPNTWARTTSTCAAESTHGTASELTRCWAAQAQIACRPVWEAPLVSLLARSLESRSAPSSTQSESRRVMWKKLWRPSEEPRTNSQEGNPYLIQTKNRPFQQVGFHQPDQAWVQDQARERHCCPRRSQRQDLATQGTPREVSYVPGPREIMIPI